MLMGKRSAASQVGMAIVTRMCPPKAELSVTRRPW